MTQVETIENPFKPKAARIVRHYDLIKDHRFFQIRHIDMKKAMSFTYNPGQSQEWEKHLSQSHQHPVVQEFWKWE